MKYLSLLLLFLISFQVQSKTIYVAANASGSNNGNSWNNAFTSLKSAIAAAQAGDEIWVAEGKYSPGSNKSDYFSMKSGVALYGGFAGNETQLAQRNPFQYKSILSGELGNANDPTDNHSQIMRFNKVSNALVSGVVFSDCYSTGFTGAVEIASCSPGFTYCSFVNNTANGSFSAGGGVTITGFDAEASPQFINCVFRNNFCSVIGGAVHSNNSDNRPIFVNCLFEGNEAARGAAIHNGGGIVRTFNCTIVNNKAEKGAASYTTSGNGTTHLHAIIWGNTVTDFGATVLQNISTAAQTLAEFSIVQGGYSGTGNLSSNPQFISTTNFRLKENSPAINAGSPTFDMSVLPSQDLDANRRVVFRRVDLGAYEFQCTAKDIYEGDFVVEACKSYKAPDGVTYTESGTYPMRYNSYYGCDSIVNIKLSILESKNQIDVDACGSFTLNGQTYTKSGNYTQILTNYKNCDSTLTIQLKVTDVSLAINQNGNTLQAAQTGAKYQWIDCSTENDIDGATDRTFQPTKNGTYAVIVEVEDCIDTSNCFNFVSIGTSEATAANLELYPNPIKNTLNVNTIIGATQINIYDLQGKTVYSNENQGGSFIINLENLADGIYILNINEHRKKIIIAR